MVRAEGSGTPTGPAAETEKGGGTPRSARIFQSRSHTLIQSPSPAARASRRRYEPLVRSAGSRWEASSQTRPAASHSPASPEKGENTGPFAVIFTLNEPFVSFHTPRSVPSSCPQFAGAGGGSRTGGTACLSGCSKTPRWPAGILSGLPRASPESV